MYVKDEYRELAVDTIDSLRRSAMALNDLAEQLSNGETTGTAILELITDELSECETALIEIEWVDEHDAKLIRKFGGDE